MGIFNGPGHGFPNTGSQVQSQLNQNQLAQQAAGSLAIVNGAGVASQAGQVLTYGAAGGLTNGYWTTVSYTPTIDPKSVISGTEIKVEDLVTRLAELEEKFKNLKFQMELMKP